MAVHSVALEACGCSLRDLATRDCTQLAAVREKAISKAVELLECVEQPDQIDDERNDHMGKVERLLRLVDFVDNLCKRLKPKRYVSALPSATCPESCATPLWDRYHNCCRG